MGKYITGTLKATLNFSDVYIEEGQNILEVLFPDGYEGEMDYSLNISSEEEDE